MAELTVDEMQFIINILAEINVSIKKPDAIQFVGNAQSCINKLSGMIDEKNSQPVSSVNNSESV